LALTGARSSHLGAFIDYLGADRGYARIEGLFPGYFTDAGRVWIASPRRELSSGVSVTSWTGAIGGRGRRASWFKEHGRRWLVSIDLECSRNSSILGQLEQPIHEQSCVAIDTFMH
jgi:hypothetical protein